MTTNDAIHNNRTDLQNPSRQLGRRSWCAFGLVAGMIILHQCLLQPALDRLTTDAPLINIAGRQRMLSQKLVKAALTRTTARNSTEHELREVELKETLAEWKNSHERLRGTATKSHSSVWESHAIENGFRDLEPHFQAMAGAAQQLVTDLSMERRQEAINTLLQHEASFLQKMHSLVGIYEEEARQHVRQLQRFGIMIMLAILLVHVAMQLFVVRPAVQLVSREIEESEAEYQRLVESMTDGLVVFQSSGNIEFANRRFGGMLGYGEESLVGKPASLFIADPDRRHFSTMLADSRPESEPVDLLMRHADGQTVSTMISAQRLIDHQGGPPGLLLVVTNVTARKAMERRSRELLDQLAHADRLRAMGTMAAALAHEINQPLGAIANYAEGCLTRLSGTKTSPQDLIMPLERILRATHRGAEIIRRAQGFVRLRPHRISIESINTLVTDVEELCRPEARRRGISLEMRLTPTPDAIPVDGIQIQQVLINLIQNAFAAMEMVEPYRRRIKVTTGVSAAGEVELSVSDTGPGIPDEGAESWFEPFITTREEGTGMGLAISRSIVEAHGGRIWAEPNGEGGACFRFTLAREIPMEPVTIADPSVEVTCHG